jgi:cell filamentation protein
LPGGFDLPHLQAIHRSLTQDLYPWGGQLRDTDTGPGGTGLAHCRPAFILDEAERIFTALAGIDLLRGRDAEEFSAGLAWVWGETTVLHPFRDVNTRSQHVFFNQLATEAGWLIDWNRIDPYVFAHARTVAIARDEKGIEALLRPALTPAAEVARYDELREKMDQARQSFFRPRPARPVRELDADLTAALRERQRHLEAPPDTRPRPHDPPGGPSLGL